jgi:hypothetical protein
VGWNWNYSGPAEALVEEIHNYFFPSTNDGTEDYRDYVRGLCHQAIKLDRDCYPAHTALGDIAWKAGDYEGMLTHFFDAIDGCDRPLDSDMLMESLFLGLYESSEPHPEVWPYIVTLRERVHKKQPQLKSIRTICIACRFSGDHSVANRVLEQWRREHPEDSVQLAKYAVKDLEDPQKAASILEDHLGEHPFDRKAERYLKRIERKVTRADSA